MRDVSELSQSTFSSHEITPILEKTVYKEPEKIN